MASSKDRLKSPKGEHRVAIACSLNTRQRRQHATQAARTGLDVRAGMLYQAEAALQGYRHLQQRRHLLQPLASGADQPPPAVRRALAPCLPCSEAVLDGCRLRGVKRGQDVRAQARGRLCVHRQGAGAAHCSNGSASPAQGGGGRRRRVVSDGLCPAPGCRRKCSAPSVGSLPRQGRAAPRGRRAPQLLRHRGKGARRKLCAYVDSSLPGHTPPGCLWRTKIGSEALTPAQLFPWTARPAAAPAPRRSVAAAFQRPDRTSPSLLV